MPDLKSRKPATKPVTVEETTPDGGDASSPPTKKTSKKPTTPTTPTTPVNEAAGKPAEPITMPDRPVVYPNVTAEICVGENAITEAVAKQLLGWQTEEQCIAEGMQLNPGSKKSDWEFDELYMLRDEDGKKVRCWNNLDNREFDESWSDQLSEIILKFQWAGSLTMSEPTQVTYGADQPTTIDGVTYEKGDTMTLPAGTINGSTICISRTGKVESGQHSLCALIKAYAKWSKNRKAYPHWEQSSTGPVLETIVITGISEDRRVLMTVDNCKPRSEADVFYTSDLFRSLLPAGRKECSRMLAAAVDLFWTRTAAKGYRTHPEIVALVDRHPKLLKCLEHIFVENSAISGRKISNLRLSAGQVACLCYLMATNGPKTDGDVYRNGMPPQEKGLDFSMLPRAKQFWAELAGDNRMQHVRSALGRLVDSSFDSQENLGLGGRAAEKFAIVAKAWQIYSKENRFPEPEELVLSYNHLDDQGNQLEDGKVKLLDMADFGGIDVPEKPKGDDKGKGPSTEEEMAKAKEEERLRRAQEAAEKIKAMRLGSDGKPATPKPVVGPSASTSTKK